MATGTLNAIDYSYAPPDYSQAFHDGINLFCRYLSPSSGKDFTAAEIKTIHGLGAGVLALWEGYADDAKKGRSEGQANGLAALGKLSALQLSVGYKPRNTPGVAFAVDYDVQPGEYHTIDDYFAGVRLAVGDKIRIGCYGHAKLLDHLTGLHLIDFGFQTYAWSYGVVSPNAHLYQFLNGQNRWGGEVDYCEIRNLSKLGGWFRPGSKYDTDDGNPETDLLEQIMALDRNSQDYKNLCKDVAAAVWQTEVIPNPNEDSRKKNPTWMPQSLLSLIYDHVKGIGGK